MPIDFVLFAATQLGVALVHHHTLRVALTGLTAITAHTVLFSPFRDGAGLVGLAGLVDEWVVIASLGLLLTGFAVRAFAVDDGGSMIWFGSSAGVAVTNVFPDARPVARWLGHGWHVAVAYVVGFAVMPVQLGWHLDAPLRGTTAPATAPHE